MNIEKITEKREGLITNYNSLVDKKVELEKQLLLKFSQNSVDEPKKQFNFKAKSNVKSKALNKMSSPGLKNMLDTL